MYVCVCMCLSVLAVVRKGLGFLYITEHDALIGAQWSKWIHVADPY